MNQPRCLAVAGQIGAGKSTIANRLAASLDARLIYVPDLLHERDPTLKSREDLARLGEELAATTGGEWLADSISDVLESTSSLVVVDAVRRHEEHVALRQRFRGGYRLIYLRAPAEELDRRLRGRASRGAEGKAAHEAEADVRDLEKVADMVFETGAATDPSEIIASIRRALADMGDR